MMKIFRLLTGVAMLSGALSWCVGCSGQAPMTEEEMKMRDESMMRAATGGKQRQTNASQTPEGGAGGAQPNTPQ